MRGGPRGRSPTPAEVPQGSQGRRGGVTARGSPPPPTRPPTPQAEAEERHLCSPFHFSPPSPFGHGSNPRPHPPPRLARGRPKVGRPQRRHHRFQETEPPARGGGGGGQGGSQPAAPQGGGEPQPALGEPPFHGRGQATGASRVTRALNPQQAQVGSRGRGGQHGKQGASPMTSLPCCSTWPLRSGLHQGGYGDVAKG